MALTPGTRIGPYEIVAALGAGGMGEVYRARDAKLHRDVAIKVLPESLAGDADRRARLEREAQALAALNHPNIAHIYGVEETSGTLALVMELVEGPTLAQQLATRGGLPVDEAVAIARQVADGLEAAHAAGIVHRDLKPANIKVRADGVVKVLDFGLAKMADPASGSATPDSPTFTSPAMTAHGVILGTAAYMAPEQARGKVADARSDLWAFGVVLYEMLTGAPPFKGATVTDLIAAVLREPIAWDMLPADTPSNVRRLLRRCLQRDPQQRLRSAGDARLELLDQDEAIQSGPGAVRPASRTWKERAVWITVGLTACAITAGLTAFKLRSDRAPTPQPVRFMLAPPPGLVWLSYNAPSISPDGRWIVSAAGPGVTGGDVTGGEESLWVRRVDELTFRRVPKGFSNPSFPWAPDSRSFFVATGAELSRVAVDGGAPQVICQLPSGYLEGVTINADGVMLIGFGDHPIHRVPPGGGAAEPVLPLDASRGETGQGTPVFLPDGVHYLFESTGKGENRIMVAALGSTERTELLAKASHPVFVPPGMLAFWQRDQLMAQRFDPARRNFEGRPTAIDRQFAPGAFAASATGTLVYSGRPGGPVRAAGEIYADNTRLAWFDRAGHELENVAPLGAYQGPRLSPDGRFVAVERFDNHTEGDIWIQDTVRHLGTRLSRDSVRDSDPAWSPRGDRIAWTSGGGGDRQAILVQRADGSDVASTLRTDESVRQVGWSGPYVSDWSPDGRYLSITRLLGPEDSMIQIVPFDGNVAVTWPKAKWPEGGALFAPDGRSVAYKSSETGRDEIYLRPFPPGPGKIRVSVDGGIDHAWRGDGRELYYLSPDRTLMAVPVQATGSTVDVGHPVALFKAPVPDPHWARNLYVPSRDGLRFLLVVLDRTVPPPAAEVIVVSNWAQAMYDELRK